MLFNGFVRPLRLKRKPSRLLALYLVSLHGLALLVLLQSLAIPVSVHVVLFFIWTISAVYHVYYYRRQRDSAQDAWVWQSGGACVRGEGALVYTPMISRSLQTPWFVMLALKTPGHKPEHLLILRDQLDADSFRRLRVRMKCAQDETTARRELSS